MDGMGDGGRETAGITTRLIVRHVRDRAGEGGVAELLAAAGVHRSAAELEDESRWSTYAEKVALFEAAAVVCADPDVGRTIGRSVLREQVGVSVRMLLWALGSPGQVFRNIAKAAPKFSTVATLRCADLHRTEAVITYELHDGYEPSRFDCDYNVGLLSQVPVLFGLGEADIEHGECQLHGAPRCVYRARWSRRFRLLPESRRRTVRFLEAELRTLMEQVESLERMASELVAADVVGTLGEIAARAGHAVRAASHQLAVRPLLGGEPWIHSANLSDAEASELAAALLSEEGPEPRVGRLVVDVASSRRFYGRLAALYPGDQTFFPEERRLLGAYAGLAATALDAAASRETSDVLLALARSLADIAGVREVCERLVAAVPLLVGAPVAAVALWDRDREVITIPASLGMGEMTAAFEALEVRQDDTPELHRMLSDPDIRTFRQSDNDPFIAAALAAFGIGAVTVVPVLRRGEMLGAIVVGWDDPHDELDPELLARISGLAAQAATAIENARLLERTTHQALHDPLTGLPNRLLLEDRISQAAARAQREQANAALLLLDLDAFKAVNDTGGHAAGDHVLRVVALRLAGLVRGMDTAARLGGDEFVMVCQDVHERPDIERIIERTEAALREPITLDDSTVEIGASIGWTIIDGSNADVRVLLHEADESMYTVKRRRSGRRNPNAVG